MWPTTFHRQKCGNVQSTHRNVTKHSLYTRALHKFGKVTCAASHQPSRSIYTTKTHDWKETQARTCHGRHAKNCTCGEHDKCSQCAPSNISKPKVDAKGVIY